MLLIIDRNDQRTNIIVMVGINFVESLNINCDISGVYINESNVMHPMLLAHPVHQVYVQDYLLLPEIIFN